MRDEWFIRGKVPMTKSEVRAISLSKLELTEGAVLADIGAGTGSVSVEAALEHRPALVWAIEKKEEALQILDANRRKAGTDKIRLAAGEALALFRDPEFRKQLSDPPVTHAFIGGTSGGMQEIVKELLSLNPQMRIVINVIALESVADVLATIKATGAEAEILSVQVARARQAGAYHLMEGQNPVYIISFGGEKREGQPEEAEEAGSSRRQGGGL